MDEMAELAGRWGIETSYLDVHGRRQWADPESIRRIAIALAAPQQPPAAAPDQRHVRPAYQGDGRRTWLLAAQLYAVRSRRNWGHGDFTDLAALVQLAGDIGAAGIGLNPLHALFSDRPQQASPYAPNSRLFLNPLYIDVEAIPEFPGIAGAGLASVLPTLRRCELVPYADVGRLKMAALRLTY